MVQSERDMLNCAGGGVLVDVATFSEVVRAAFVIEVVAGVGERMVLNFSSQGLKTKYSKLRLKSPTRLIICPSEELTNLSPTDGVESFSWYQQNRENDTPFEYFHVRSCKGFPANRRRFGSLSHQSHQPSPHQQHP